MCIIQILHIVERNGKESYPAKKGTHMREFSDVIGTTWKRNFTIYGEKYVWVDVNETSVQAMKNCLDVHPDICLLQEANTQDRKARVS
jgi:Tfp pilus assembly ATPase PilU